jgi:predicted nucleic acid-binding protein
VKRLVVDASVAGKWFFPEQGSETASALLDGKRELLAPDLIVAEFGNLVWKKTRRREVAFPRAEEMLRTFLRLPLTLHSATALAETAWPLAAETGLTFYDSLYLALGIRERCRVITADKKVIKRVRKRGLDYISLLTDMPLCD